MDSCSPLSFLGGGISWVVCSTFPYNVSFTSGQVLAGMVVRGSRLDATEIGCQEQAQQLLGLIGNNPPPQDTLS